jgi:hypothetical protein
MKNRLRILLAILLGATACNLRNRDHEQSKEVISDQKKVVLTPVEFRMQWLIEPKDRLVSYTAEELQASFFGLPTKQFLKEAGLPASAPPFLSFNEKVYSPVLRNVKQYYKLQGEDFSSYYVIGSEGGGDVICIDTKNQDQIMILSSDHIHTVDNEEEQDYHPQFVPVMFMNSSIHQLAECLLVYRNFVSTIRAEHNGQSFVEITPSADALTKLAKELEAVDLQSIKEKSFWWYQIQEHK